MMQSERAANARAFCRIYGTYVSGWCRFPVYLYAQINENAVGFWGPAAFLGGERTRCIEVGD